MTYQESIYYLETLYNFDRLKKQDRRHAIPRTRQFLNLIGNPEKKLDFIHVAGTSGKGSIATMLNYILTESKIDSGLLVSPHVADTTERISINTKHIPRKTFAQYVHATRPSIDRLFASEHGQPTYQEIMLAIALKYFVDQKCKYAIIEAGMGGRFDYTNVIPSPIIAIISNIGIDHTKLIGTTYAQRTQEKAGIIKKGSMLVTAEQRAELCNIFKGACKVKKSTYHSIDEYRVEYNIITHHDHTTTFANVTGDTFLLGLTGQHQVENALIAKKTAELLGISAKKIRAGLEKTRLIARVELIRTKPYLIVDSAHNPQKMEALVKTIQNLTYKNLFLIIGITEGKDYKKMFRALKRITQKNTYILATRFKSYYKKSINPLRIIKEFTKQKNKKRPFLDAQDALFYATKHADKNDLILITGSMYLAGELYPLLKKIKQN